jgi:plasmid maintenance system antidote protein VapI
MTDLHMQLQYDPNRLLDTLLDHMGLKNDAALARRLKVSPPVVSKIRHLTLTVGATMLIRMHDESGLSIRELRHLMGDYCDNSFMPPGISKK